jgi:hypothetical protein
MGHTEYRSPLLRQDDRTTSPAAIDRAGAPGYPQSLMARLLARSYEVVQNGRGMRAAAEQRWPDDE